MMDRKHVYDCVIVGGGSAGLSAALMLGRARRRVLVCDKGKPRNSPAAHSHSFFTRDGTAPLELLTIGRDQLASYASVEFQASGVTAIRKIENRFQTVFEDGSAAQSRKVLLAFGVTDELPEIENFARFWGTSVFHCPYCHAFEMRDEPLAVMANGAAAVEKTALLRNWSVDTVLCTNGVAELTAAERDLLKKHEIKIYEEKIIRLEGADGRLESIVFETGEKIARRGLLFPPKQHLRSDLAAALGCRLTDSELIEAGEFNETSVGGVYAAGDIISPMQQIATAVWQGTVAAAGINRALIGEDFV